MLEFSLSLPAIHLGWKFILSSLVSFLDSYPAASETARFYKTRFLQSCSTTITNVSLEIVILFTIQSVIRVVKMFAALLLSALAPSFFFFCYTGGSDIVIRGIVVNISKLKGFLVGMIVKSSFED